MFVFVNLIVSDDDTWKSINVMCLLQSTSNQWRIEFYVSLTERNHVSSVHEDDRARPKR